MGDTQDACPNSHGPCPAGSRPSLPSPVRMKVQRPCPSQEAGLCLQEASRKEADLFVCLFVEEVTVCPQKPARVQGTNQSLGRGCFCFVVQIRVQLWKSPKYMALENENTAEELGYGG